MKYLKTEAHKLNNSKLGIRIYNARSVLSHYMEQVFPYRSSDISANIHQKLKS